MQRIAGADVDPNGAGAGIAGFRAGTPGVEAGTEITPAWLTDVQEELVALAELSGAVTLGASRRQAADAVLAAISAALANQVVADRRIKRTCLVNPETFDGPAASPTEMFSIGNLNSIASRSVIVSQSGVFYSIDFGESWSAQALPVGFSGTPETGCSFLNGSSAELMLVSGGAGCIATGPVSGSGPFTLTQRAAAGGYSGRFSAAAPGPTGALIAGESGEIQTTADGVTFVHRSPANSYGGTFSSALYAPFASGARYVLGGDASEIQTSPDTVTWTKRTAPPPQYVDPFTSIFWSAAFGQGVAVLVGSAGLVWSSDGITWMRLSIDTASPSPYWVIYSEAMGLFVIGALGGLFTWAPGDAAATLARRAWNPPVAVFGDFFRATNAVNGAVLMAAAIGVETKVFRALLYPG